MICELCGKESECTKLVFIEGSQLRVCKECTKFGEGETSGGKGVSKRTESAPSRAMVTERLQARERRMRTKDVYQEETQEELVSDFPKRIREARSAKGLKQEELAAKINERVSVIAKLETGTMRPDDQLIKKLEHELGIKITEKVTLMKPESNSGQGKTLTLGDMIKVKK